MFWANDKYVKMSSKKGLFKLWDGGNGNTANSLAVNSPFSKPNFEPILNIFVVGLEQLNLQG